VKRLRRFTPIAVALASVLIIIGAGAKRYLIVVPTLTTPFLPNPNVAHYHPTWVEWSITFAGVAVFLLMYMLFTKVFPMVSIWETRQDEVPEGNAVAPAPKPSSRRWRSISGVSAILVAFLVLACGNAKAEPKPPAKPPQPTTLLLEYRQVAAPQTDETQNTPSGRLPRSGLDRFFGRLLGWTPTGSGDRTETRPSMQVTAILRDSKGQPLSYQVLSLSLKTSFGTLDFGSRPTDEEGKAIFLIKDRRYGRYPVECTYEGGTDFAAAKATATVDFGPRPAPSLPSEGVLIGPNANAVIAIPFFGFFGFAWFVFLFVGVYVLFWRLPRIRTRSSQKVPLSQIKQRSNFPTAYGLQGRKAAGSSYRIMSPHRRP